MKYYNLSVHSCYDLLNSTIKLEELFSKLRDNGVDSVCISDPNMYGAIKSYKLSKKYGINLIHALEVKVSYDLEFVKFNIISKNEKMFKILCKLSSIIQTEDSEITTEFLLDFLQEHKEDFILLVVSEFSSLANANELIKKLAGFDYYFGYNENFNYNIYGNIKKIVYVKESNYLDKNDYQTLVVVRAIRDNSKLNIQELTENFGENFVYTNFDIENIYNNMLNPLEKEVFLIALKNQQKIIDKCKYSLNYEGYKLPKYVYSEKEEIFKDKSSIEYLRYLVLKGSKTKLVGKNIHLYKKRFDYELQIIEDMGFADYFLIVYDFVKYAKDNGIYVGAGRGSAAGSLVCYLLNITEADPIEYNLLFERFLNKERISMPDIDIDFQDTKRDEVIKYVEEKYGKEKVAQIITYTTFQSKSSARESARILQFSEKDLKTISNMIDSNKTLEECYENSAELQNFINSSEYNKRWFKVARSLENLPKNTSVHAAGVVISDNNNLVEYSPLEKSNVTHYLTQWTMDDIEEVGLLKIDFLGIRYLTMVESIVKEIQKQEPEFDINKINFKDKKVYKLFAEGKTEGIFQFESGGIKEKLRILKPTEFNDIVAMNALYRPGPMAQIETYVKRKHGLEQVEYLHPKLEKILKDTYGVIVYQEQIMLIAVNFAHMSLNEADNMRRAVSKKKKEDLEKYGELFIEKAISSGYSREIANKLFRLIVIFANYGFNKSHAVVYSMLAYKLAYLKVHYNRYFMTALLNNVISSEKKINEYKQELNNAGITLLKPDVNLSLVNFSVYKKDIIFALISIKNVGYRAASEIVNDRVKFGKYQDIDDFLRRMNKKVDYQAAVSLVKAGALDTFGYNRATTMNKIKDYYEDTRDNIDDIRFAISSISGLTLKTEEIEDYTIYEKISMEKEVTGTYFLKHPVQVEKEKYYYLPLSYMSDKESDSYVEVINIKEIKTKKGDYMAFLTVNDGKADKDVTIFPNVYKYASVLLKNNQFLVLSVTPQIRNDRLQYILEKVATLENYKEYCLNNIKQIYVLVDEDNKEFIKNNAAPNGSAKLICIFKDNNISNKVTSVENAHLFVRKYMEHFSGKPIKIGYTSK
ncbi:DNA polymerase III subunit alpha [Gemelliphila palaticanis]|uniref:DNA-directed DNA polymerase n=1 Tax=Gemelliphila palaticanis TaxID=81950 RepID=A0ABX2T3P2_9BACL|nr:DNA polymerase III subunit alpha [Gemella palaticanis]MBF0715930.1 DNA polymerase III subunit alpha [Gemella palaticanis]NYS47860.1 DNA polymerase III subunit alpha [Gemella palaticanis]